MSYTAKKFLNIVLAEVGYLEKKSAAQLDDKSANAGSANYTKYARDLFAAGYYSGNKQGVAWCSMFADWCHYMAADKNKAVAQAVSCQSGIYGASCTCSMNYYQAAGRFYKNNPQPGDQIYFGSGKSSTHTGIVYKTDGKYVYTVEGNTSPQSGVVPNGGGVYKKSYVLTDSRILGYGRPKWSSMETAATPKFSIALSVLKKGSTGKQVQALQNLLTASGCDCGSWGADGNFGSATENAVKAYQKNNGLQVDGAAGPETWGSLLGAA